MLNPRIIQYTGQIENLRSKIKFIQDKCPHEGTVKTPGADTGNWCKDDDSYWYDCNCFTCGKIWREDQ